MGAMSKTKGHSAERALAKLLGEIFDGSFVRSAGSGAFIGGKNVARKEKLSDNQIRNTKSDIIPPDHMPKLVIEAKSYALFRFHQIIHSGSCAVLDGWIEQTRTSIDEGDFWLVAFKVNRITWSVAVPLAATATLKLGNHALYTNSSGTYVITELLSFMKTNRDEIVRLSQGA